jgi:hypothetical protein
LVRVLLAVREQTLIQLGRALQARGLAGFMQAAVEDLVTQAQIH